jgi:LPXTG-motif cell wall-anchored protein
MLLAAVVAMVLAATVPALAQTVTQVGNGNAACVQNAVQNNIVGNNSPQGNGNAQANQYGDNVIINNISNVSAQAISQECNITVAQVNAVAKKALTFNKAGNVVVVKKQVATATASASAAAPVKSKAAAPVQYKAAAPVQYKAAAPTQYQYQAAAVQYQYASASAAPAAAAALPETGGSSLIALGAGVLLVAGGLLARRIVR